MIKIEKESVAVMYTLGKKQKEEWGFAKNNEKYSPAAETIS